MSSLYTVDQFGVVRKGEVLIPLMDGQPLYEEYLVWLKAGGVLDSIHSEHYIDPSVDPEHVVSNAIVKLKGMLDAFVELYKARFPQAELDSFADKAAQANDWLANGDTAFNAPLKAEAMILSQASPEVGVADVVNDIMANYQNSRVMIPFVAGIRQVLTEQLKGCTQVYQTEQVLQAATIESLQASFATFLNNLSQGT